MNDTPPLPPAIRTWMHRRGDDAGQIVALTGDASDRRYFRVLRARGVSSVLALYSAPFDLESHPFVKVTGLFAAIPVPVPRILTHADDLGILELEDLGDVSLQTYLTTADQDQRHARYHEAMALVARLQRGGRELADPSLPPFQSAFDVAKLSWELDFFTQHFLEAYRGAVLDSAEHATLRREYLVLARELASEPRVLCHRDYHSRNLMVRDDRLVIIDHQDARMGPDTYDLASLLRDAYVEFAESEVDALIGHFLGLFPGPVDPVVFRTRFDLMALQRTLKALGTFGHQATARRNSAYVGYMDRTLELVRRSLTRHERFGRLHAVLATHLEELR